MRDILLVMSDQHSWAYTGFAGSAVDTPNMERIAGEGWLWERCYCNAPLCVPSRMSFLSGLLPSELGIFNNDTTLPIDMPTIAHDLGAMGYQTALIGRMHFKGDDQNHGFDVRLAGDITSQYWGTGGKSRTDFGAFAGTTNRKHCLEAVGGGYSPVMVYDEQVLKTALEYLEGLRQERERGESREPVFLIIGFYGPHFPFTCSPELYRKYKERLEKEDGDKEKWREGLGLAALPEYADYLQSCTEEKALNCRAAYCGLVETLDGYVGQLYDVFCGMEQRAGRQYAFLYTSDHGEQLGKRKIFGKQTLYEDAVRVPFIAAGSGCSSGSGRMEAPLSLLDISKGIMGLAASDEEKEDLFPEVAGAEGNPVRIQQILEYKGALVMAEAVICYPYKVVRIGEQVRVFHLLDDPEEKMDLSAEQPEVVRSAMEYFMTEREAADCLARERAQRLRHQRLKAWGKAKHPKEPAVMIAPEAARKKPAE